MIAKLTNPATEETLGEIRSSDPGEIEHNVAFSTEAFTRWRHIPLETRFECVKTLETLLQANRVALAEQITNEMGKPLRESLGEIDKCVVSCASWRQHFSQWKSLAEYEVGGTYLVRREPLGLVLGIMPWNFPLWQVVRFAVPAILCGNTVAVKHAPNTWGVAERIGELFAEAFPYGVYSNLKVDIKSVPDLIHDSRIRAVSLTGSRQAGASVAALAGAAIKKCVLELGGSDAYVILDDADLDLAAEMCANGRLINAGQSCVAAKRFIVTSKNKKAFTERLESHFLAAKWGDPKDPAVRIGPMARQDLRDSVHAQVQSSLRQGAKLVLGGQPTSINKKGFFYPPTLLTEVQPGQAAFDEETFGPVGAVIEATDEAQALELANSSRYGLGGAIFSRDIERAQKLAVYEMDSGMVWINDFVKSDVLVPFGGVKESGIGREIGREGAFEFTNVKTVKR